MASKRADVFTVPLPRKKLAYAPHLGGRLPDFMYPIRPPYRFMLKNSYINF